MAGLGSVAYIRPSMDARYCCTVQLCALGKDSRVKTI